MEVKTKICSKCKEVKGIDNFNVDKRVKTKISYVSRCKSCLNLLNKNYRKTYVDTRNRVEYKKNYYMLNKSKFSTWNKNWRNNNNRSEYYRKYRSKNISAKIACCCRNRIRNCIKKGYKSQSSLFLTGCKTWDELKNHLEKKFTNGMSWANMGEWHIDHIIPCSSFDLTNIEQQMQCFHYSNLQPLWAKDNLSKSDKIV
jgi:hypothetical protein